MVVMMWVWIWNILLWCRLLTKSRATDSIHVNSQANLERCDGAKTDE